MSGARAAALLVALSLASSACDPCEEDVRAQTLDDVGAVVIEGLEGGERVELRAEIARTQVERERGWKHRRCGLEGAALAIALEPAQDLEIWACDVTVPLDLLFVRDEQLVAIERALAPCPSPCGGCPRVSAGEAVEFVVEVPHGELEGVSLSPGARIKIMSSGT